MADEAPDRLEDLIRNRAESISVEFKTWIDPLTDEGVAKIVRSVFALRNRNGGFLIIGMDDKSLQQDSYPLSRPVEEAFHFDLIQSIISKYSSPILNIEVQFRKLENQNHPIIIVPPGVRVPIIVKSDLRKDGRNLLSVGDLYFRTLQANHTVSTAKILPRDYDDLMEICFNNREADIGAFFRRQIGQADLKIIKNIMQSITDDSRDISVDSSVKTRAFDVIAHGAASFKDVMTVHADDARVQKATEGLTMQVGLIFDPEKSNQVPTQEFLNKISSANPQFTGWPIWLDSRGFSNKECRPVVRGNAWEANIVDLGEGWSKHLEFLQFNPNGKFYLRRAMQDDLSDSVIPGTSLDVFLMLLRISEVLAVGVNFGRAMDWNSDGSAGFAFKWSGLENRQLNDWANPLQMLALGSRRSVTKEVDSFVEVPIGTPHNALAPYLMEVVAPLFAVFDGYQISDSVAEHALRRLLERRL